MPSHASRARSVSGEIDESSDLSGHEDGGSNPSGKPGRKKNPNSQAARRDQNRIAQREFRLRKQQRIRDLEASVEMLSGGKDEALATMRKVLKDLMHENHVLRDLLRSLSSFIGDGAGGLLPKLGWDLNDFNSFLNKSETDTAWESYQRHKQQEAADAAASGSQPAAGQKRPQEDDSLGGPSKRTRGASEQNGERERADSFSNPMLVPLQSTGPSVPQNGGGLYTASTRPHDSGLLNEFLRTGASGPSMVMSASSPTAASGSYGTPSTQTMGGSYPNSFMQSGLGVHNDAGIPPMPMVGASPVSVQQPRVGPTPPAVPEEDDVDSKKTDAYKLVHYHLDNYKRNSAYCLPSSLRPTLVQRTVPHESVIDAIVHPELRDRMILLRGRFDLVDCLHDYRNEVTIHGDDVLAHTNWELSETWLHRYKFLVDQATLAIANRWRRERGEGELRLADFQDPHPTV
ncbi:uncharacterized protein C8Q71DRAFT_26635 [Rhodofomes roseus]|uniref:BZIP domain-containing protein n=1 Tax=Rhodofomes roseus TaxID=34475 RepID=A0ABQ8KXM2_9APHY|nr:uncharacterized protein C8Q71DRAFT_26635 [Rhodofomes roseus]KAH9844049.1 hypothetical protein C8Q71DRAFT_26635 [Rhodofomes roseus]